MRTLALLVAAILPASLAAQPADSLHAHDGFWIGFGVGPGHAELDCAAACGAPAGAVPRTWRGGTGAGFTFALGGTPRRNFLMGGELGAVVRPGVENRAGIGWLAFVTQGYPVARRGLFVRAGLGFGAATLEDESLGTTEDQTVTTSGFSVHAGVGYDVRFGGRFGLAPMAQYVTVIGDGDEVTLRGRRFVGPKNPSALLVGLGFHWY